MLGSSFVETRKLPRSLVDPRIQLAAPFTGYWRPNGQTRRKLNPDGLSGGAILGVWPNDVRLVGIATDYDPARKLLIGTRLNAVFKEYRRRAAVS